MTRSAAVLSLALFWCPVATYAQTDGGASIATPGIHERVLPEAGRRYTLAIPAGYTGGEPTPLIVSLHYGGQVTPFYGRGLLESLIEPALRELGAIIVAPDSAAGSWANPTSEQHVLELLDHIENLFNIDSERTLLTGYSMGGGGTWYLAPRHPDRFRAALVMAGRPQDDSATLDWNTPLYVIHSSADQVVSLESTLSVVERLRSRGADIDLVVLNDITHYEIPRYRTYLADAKEWILEAWAR